MTTVLSNPRSKPREYGIARGQRHKIDVPGMGEKAALQR